MHTERSTPFSWYINKLNIDLSYYRNHSEIVELNTPQTTRIHILSNILDIESIDLSYIVSIITHMRGDNIIITADPLFNKNRITDFVSQIEAEVPTISYKLTYLNDNFDNYDNSKEYGCIYNIIGFNISDEYAIRDEVKGVRFL